MQDLADFESQGPVKKSMKPIVLLGMLSEFISTSFNRKKVHQNCKYQIPVHSQRTPFI